jgi:hypothetical protein
MNSEFEGTDSTMAGTRCQYDVATTCRTASCMASLGPLRTMDFSSFERTAHMESFQNTKLHVTFAWMSKEADVPVVYVTIECRTLTKLLNGRPDTIPTTRFHVPASIMASSILSKCHQVCITMLYVHFDNYTYAQVLVRPTSILPSDSLVQGRDWTIHTNTRQQSSPPLSKSLVA